ncbi:MAG: undecaprenyldiphospho-muramoylpentapeptide beta-N-acetylglucosaminyltransferase, partial [Deltaproteobacteria bacterium]|nr:undecaprenyldiphospho-muramoylpentapeptide beta-N-acetylglucosaminyltransferase [Deltaproteobacteria bacterium]
GGGTGGHLFPAVAVAEEVLGRNPENAVLFIGTERGLEGKILRGMGFQLKTIEMEGIRGRGVINIIRTLFKVPRSMVQSRSIIRDFHPDIVLGVGGYASGPAVMAAYFMGIRTAIAEQNVLPGFTNRILGKFVDKSFISFPETKEWFPEKRVVITGNPVRTGFLNYSKKIHKSDDKFTLLIFGGSQGASSINMAAVEALNYLEGIKDRLKIIHQTGTRDLDKVSKAYNDRNIDAEVYPFINDMVSAYRSADLLICRSGATSIAEITASGKAALFIPYPFAAGNHQALNARALVDKGAAEMISERSLNGERLAEVIERLYRAPERIREMKKKSAILGNKRAAADITDECLDLIG